ncbi:hypothetical protein RBSH_05851 [Rhodopirellula baltica SH28]|uniref:Uncharacterized protein n=1 Tax=Rhodopirellula baltica SH28 TaxID=993517 RepID=K5D8M5_RHOBT|nr:hypothetical protein RBSH_05851 [Rhodopirellula baltica SH28]
MQAISSWTFWRIVNGYDRQRREKLDIATMPQAGKASSKCESRSERRSPYVRFKRVSRRNLTPNTTAQKPP